MSNDARDSGDHARGQGTDGGDGPQPRGCAGVFFMAALVIAAAWGAGLGVFVWILEDAEAPIKALEDFRPKIGSRMYSGDGEELGEFAVETRRLVPLSEMPLTLQKAFIATEDHTFYEHKGVRPLAIASAVLDAFRTSRLRGASTITQQTVRNIETTGISNEVTIRRKIVEAVSALQLEREFTKDEILEMYLNQIFLGISAYGVESAAQQYYAKSVSELTLGECATLAGLTRAPNKNQPFKNPEYALIRRDIVLKQMLNHGFITQSEYEAGIAESLDESVVTPEERRALRAADTAVTRGQFKAPYFSEAVRRFIENPPAPYEVSASSDEFFEGGLEIHTTVDMRLQRIAEKVLVNAQNAFDADRLDLLKKVNREKEFVPVSAALVCLDNRKGYEGFVRAMVGGRDFATKKFNLATQAKRQPGSSVKPFVWLAAIDNGMTPSDMLVDEPFARYNIYTEKVWEPQNFGSKFGGPMTLRHGLENSINIVSIKLVDRFKVPLIRSYMKSAGFKEPIYDVVGLTLGLGTPVTTAFDQAACYTTLALGGVRVEPTLVTEIRDRDGFVRYDYKSFRSMEPNALPADATYSVVHLMKGVCEPESDYYPSGWRTNRLRRPHAGKTGTTNESFDVWFCGFTPDYTCVVWFGYEDYRSLNDETSSINFTGGRLASPVWTDFMIEAHEGLPVRDFPVPGGVEFYNVDRQTGLAGGTYREVFIDGATPPTEMPFFDLREAPEKLPENLITDRFLEPSRG